MTAHAIAAPALALAAAGLAGCAPDTLPARPPNPTHAPTHEAGGLSVYDCDNGERVKARYPSRDRAFVTYRGRPHEMTIARSADGARYIGDGFVWWAKGTGPGAEAILFQHPDDTAGEQITRCSQTGD